MKFYIVGFYQTINGKDLVEVIIKARNLNEAKECATVQYRAVYIQFAYTFEYHEFNTI